MEIGKEVFKGEWVMNKKLRWGPHTLINKKGEEREKQLKLALSNLEKNIQPQDNSSDITRLN